MQASDIYKILFVAKALSILLIETNGNDAWNIERAFQKQDYKPEIVRVDTENDLIDVLQSASYRFDIVLSDYNLPGFNGMNAVSLVKAQNEFMPVILVSGHVGEEQAADLIRAGADDYVVKGNLSRLFPAVERELQRAETKKARARAEKQLEESEERFSLIFHFSPDPMVITTGPNFEIDTVNRAFLEFAHKSVREIFNTSMYAVVNWTESHKIQESAENLRDGREIEPFEVTYTDQRGKTHTIIWSVSTMPNENRQSQLWIGKDITEIKAIHKHIRESERLNALGTLAGGIAHDFNNILMVMLGYNEMSLDKLDGGSRVRQYQEEINAAILRARDLVQQILAFSRKSEGELQILQIDPTLTEVVKLLKPSLPSTIRIEADLQSSGFIKADPSHIHQIAMNLCTNSYHAMRNTGGVMSISTYDIDDYVEVTVKDTGIGMTPEVLEHVFDPFFTTKEVGEGTGLGLSVVHGIILSYRGEIHIDSEPNVGTKIKCRLPVTTEDAAPVSSECDEPEPNRPKNKHVVAVVDDERKIADLLANMLEEIGYQVDVYYSSRQLEAAVIGNEKQYSCIVSDITMPVITGFDLAERVHSFYPEIPFIFCSGSDLSMHEKESLRDDVTYLTKPVRRSELLRVVGEVIETKQRELDR